MVNPSRQGTIYPGIDSGPIEDNPVFRLVRVPDSNRRFWRTEILSDTRGSYEEKIQTVKERPWRFFRFVSDGPEIHQHTPYFG